MIITIIIIFKEGAQLALILSVASRSIRLRHIIDLQDTESRYFVMTEFSYLLFDHRACYFGGARSKGFATLRNVSKLTFIDKIGQVKSVGFRFYSAIWRSETRISSRYLDITSISLIYSLTFSRKKELLFWLSRGLNRLTCVTCQIRGDSKLRD